MIVFLVFCVSDLKKIHNILHLTKDNDNLFALSIQVDIIQSGWKMCWEALYYKNN